MSKHPGYDWAADGELFVLRWHRVSVEAVDHLDEVLAEQRRRVGKQLYFVALIGPETQQPDEAGRAYMLERFSKQHASFLATHAVVLGSGVRTVLARTILTAMMMIANRRGNPFRVDRDLRDMAQQITKLLGRDPERTLAWLRDSGLVKPSELG